MKVQSRVSAQAPGLGPFLDQLLQSYHLRTYLSSDPLRWAHTYNNPWDQEVVALLSALLAYGNVKQVHVSVQGALGIMEKLSGSPRSFIEALSSKTFSKKAMGAFSGYVHRFNPGADLVSLFKLVQLSWKKYGSVGSQFLSYLDPDATDITQALTAILSDWRGLIPEKSSRGLQFLLSSPENKSCCKRWCMFLRWMGRKDDLDLGLWTKQKGEISPEFKLYQATFPKNRFLQPSQLVMPLDTHTGRISRYLGLTSKNNMSWKAAQEVTKNLKILSPKDPTRYDFAISRLGILSICQKKYRPEICIQCQLKSVCKLGVQA